MSLFHIVLSIHILASVDSFLHEYPKIDLRRHQRSNAGNALILTPYIENGDIATAKRLARVPFTELLDIKSYSGYFTVNKTYDSNQFFWYFPAIVNNTNAPVMLWLQGGPGVTSLYGLFTENGPLKVRHNKFQRRKLNWALNHHMIYVDNPVGTGFSFTKDQKGYCTNEKQISEQLYSTMIQFFKLFPELQASKFFVSGESYAGKYVPTLAYTIHKKNPEAKVKINLKGIAIGNGLSDPENQLEYSKYLYQIGIIDWNQAKIFEDYENRTINFIKEEKWEDAYDTFDNLLNGDNMLGKSIFRNITGFKSHFNYLHTNNYIKDADDFGAMIQRNAVRNAIHVGDQKFNDGSKVLKHLKQDVMKSVAPIISELLDHYNVLIYSGQLDIICAYPLTVNYLRKLKFNGSKEYETAPRYIWEEDGDVAGYIKQVGHLFEILVRNAGHMVPGDQPKWALKMITDFTHETLLGSSNGDEKGRHTK